MFLWMLVNSCFSSHQRTKLNSRQVSNLVTSHIVDFFFSSNTSCLIYYRIIYILKETTHRLEELRQERELRVNITLNESEAQTCLPWWLSAVYVKNNNKKLGILSPRFYGTKMWRLENTPGLWQTPEQRGTTCVPREPLVFSFPAESHLW